MTTDIPDFIRRIHDRMCASTITAGNTYEDAVTTTDCHDDGSHYIQSQDDSDINNVRHRTVSTMNETFYFLEQRLDAMQKDAHEVAALKEEFEELSLLREWAKPQVQELAVF